MSLLDEFASECVLFEKRTKSDGEGGYYVSWEDGITFTNYQALDTSMEARRAEKEGVTSVYSALVRRDVPIEYGDYFRDNATGSVYRVTSEPMAKQAPRSSMLNLKYFTAERKELPL